MTETSADRAVPASFWAGWNRTGTAFKDHWDVKEVMDDLDRRVPHGGMYRWLKHVCPDIGKGHVLSLGSGHGHKELSLLKYGLAAFVTACDISKARCQMFEERAAEAGMQKKTRIVCCDAMKLLTTSTPYDMVHWDNSLHHMRNTDEVLELSWKLLKPGGVLYVNEYVGPNHMQWSDAELEIANGIRSGFPEAWFGSKPDRTWCTGKLLGRRPLSSISADEAPDSRTLFERMNQIGLDCVRLGGIGYFASMSGLYRSVRMPNDSVALQNMLKLDRAFSDCGIFCYACGIAVKR